MPVGPGVNPLWTHQTLRLQVGGVEYAFETLSLLAVWSCWQHMGAVGAAAPALLAAHEAIGNGRPLEPDQASEILRVSDHVVKILEVIQPTLAADEERLKGLTPEHFTELFAFYSRQDWSRIIALVKRETAIDDDPNVSDPEEAHGVFMAICAQAAKHCNMPMLDFVRTRFEFAADQIISLRRAAEKAQEEAGADEWRNAAAKLAATFGTGAPSIVNESQQPEWMRALNKVRVN